MFDGARTHTRDVMTEQSRDIKGDKRQQYVEITLELSEDNVSLSLIYFV